MVWDGKEKVFNRSEVVGEIAMETHPSLSLKNCFVINSIFQRNFKSKFSHLFVLRYVPL